MATVNFAAPTDYSAEAAAIERQRRLAESLRLQADQPLGDTKMAGGWAIRNSPFEGLAKALRGYNAGATERDADARQKALGEKYQNDLTSTLSSALRVGTGSPARPAQMDPQEVEQQADQGTAPPENIAAQAPDRAGMAAILMRHPATQAMGIQQLSGDMQRQALVAALSGGQGAPAGQPGTAGTTATPGAQGAAVGGPAGGVPMAAWIQADPTGKSYMEQLAKDHMEATKPQIDRGYGIKKWNPATQKYELASNPADITAVERAKLDATQPFEAPITLKTSSGQDIQLSRPEWADYQKTGKLPQRLGGPTPTEITQAPSEAAAVQAIKDGGFGTTNAKPMKVEVQPGLGTIGATQTQGDAIKQAGQTAANTEASKEFISEMRQNYAKLRDVPATLENIERAKQLAAGQAQAFMGPLGESKLAITKFLRANVPGMGNIKTDSVTSAEELQSTLFNQVMDNLKKMDASPSQYQQQVMQEAFGTLRTDPQSVPKIMDVFSDILRNRVSLHNETVKSAESRGTTFPYDVSVKLKDKPNVGPSPDAQAVFDEMRRRGLVK